MAIDRHHFRLILEAGAKGSCLSAGYPDLLIHLDDIPSSEQLSLKPRPDSEELQGYHGFDHPIYDSVDVFDWLGLKLDVIDREKRQGSEIVLDLNDGIDFDSPFHPWQDYTQRYDLVIDPGTSEHCFNIAQAANNLADAVKLGGHIAQAIPMAMFNHGYYNLNPIWFQDFYTQNGFIIKRLLMRWDKGIEQAPLMRVRNIPDGAVILCLAQRVKVQPFVYPQQSC